MPVYAIAINSNNVNAKHTNSDILVVSFQISLLKLCENENGCDGNLLALYGQCDFNFKAQAGLRTFQYG